MGRPLAAANRMPCSASARTVSAKSGVHKGAALLRLGERLGVPPEGMMAFGDTFNDAEMLKAAKYGFLVENGSPALREEVPFLAPPNTNSGVMQILRRVLAQNGRVCESDFRRAK